MNNKEIVKKTKKFLKEYQILCQKFGMGFTGCGCCGSPILNIEDNKTIQLYNVTYDIDSKEVKVFDGNFDFLKIDKLKEKNFYIEE